MRRKLNREEVRALKHNLLELSQVEDDFYFLDSCNLDAPLKEGKYELLVAIGAVRKLSQFETNGALDELQHFLMKGKWYFGTLSYELKNDIENLSSQNVSQIACPVITFIEPKTVVSVDKNNVLEVFGDASALIEEIFSQTSSETTDERHYKRNGKDLILDMDRESYLDKVREIHNQILQGNVYEMNLCYSRSLRETEIKRPHRLFSELIKRSPVPFAALVKCSELHLLCASPERFLSHSEGVLLSQPIKGTAPRGKNAQEDLFLKDQLYNSEKERAENVMIVDLVRNDLAKCSKTGSVQVRELFGIHSYAQVHQMVSSIEAELSEGIEFADILRAAFPMGSMTGTPKIAAMELIEELENSQRAWYSGSLGYIEPNGNFDFNVVIRSILYDSKSKNLTFGVGGAITIDSNPENEWAETELKALAIESVLGID